MIFRRRSRPNDISFTRDNEYVEYSRQNGKLEANQKNDLLSYKPNSVPKSLIITLPPSTDHYSAAKPWKYFPDENNIYQNYWWRNNSFSNKNINFFLNLLIIFANFLYFNILNF